MSTRRRIAVRRIAVDILLAQQHELRNNMQL